MALDVKEDQAFQEDIPGNWWASLLRALVPFARLVTPSALADPVVAIGLPESTPRRDTSMLSAYYLLFYS